MIGPNDPVRLAEIIPLAFPHGGMTPSGLRREAQRGRLEIMRIAGKDFTTLSAIEEMKQKCRVKSSRPDYGSDRQKATVARSGSSSTAESNIALDAAQMIVKRLKNSSRNGARHDS